MSSGENLRGIPRPLSGGPVKFGPYWLESRLAVGGTAEVYVARPIDATAQPRKLIVKRLLPHFVGDAEGRTMFEREVALHQAVHDPNVVQVYGSGMDGDEPWLAMELVDGCDLYRLLRRLAGATRKLPVGVVAYIARQALSALHSVHTARDPAGTPLGIIHRDVTPSNIYLSVDGVVKVGDFGIARSASRATLRSAGSAMIKGKFAYLAPEQVAGDAFDHRADLFALAVVVAEMLLGKPLFAGSGQLAVLLAIRDCRIDPLRDARGQLPRGLFEILERALAREPAQRFPSASALSDALAPFDPQPAAAKTELGALVRWVQSSPSNSSMKAVPPVKPRKIEVEEVDLDEIEEPNSETLTGQYAAIPSRVRKQTGEQFGPWTFARLVEALATGQVGRGDQVDYLGAGYQPVETIEDLARFLPAMTATTNRLGAVGAPEFADDVSIHALLKVLLRVVETEGAGVLFAEGPTESRRLLGGTGTLEAGRKELYFVGGKLHHVASNNASELLGEWLVRRQVITRDELEFALAVLPRYGGRMGDTLISLGLVGSLEIFQAIRDQGRARLVDLFQWPAGKLSFYPDQRAPHVEFPLDLDLVPVVVAGMEAAQPGESPVEMWRPRLDAFVGPSPLPLPKLRAAAWPAVGRKLLDLVVSPMRVRDALAVVTADGGATSDALRALEALIAGELLVTDARGTAT